MDALGIIASGGELALSGGGGGSGPAPTVLIDFKNGVYQSNGSNVARSSLMTEDSDNWFTFDVNDIIPGTGYSPAGGQGPVLIGDCVAALAAGGSIRFDINLGDATSQVYADLVKKWTYDPDIRLMMSAAIDAPTSVTDFTASAVSSTPALGAGDHIVAATLSNGSIAISANGEADVTQAISAWSTTPDGIGVATGGSGAKTIRSIKIYQPGISPLSSLSGA